MTFVILHLSDKRIGLLPVFVFHFDPWKNFPYVIPIFKPILEEQKVSLYRKHTNFLIFKNFSVMYFSKFFFTIQDLQWLGSFQMTFLTLRK